MGRKNIGRLRSKAIVGQRKSTTNRRSLYDSLTRQPRPEQKISRPNEWVEVWSELRRKQNAFDQGWTYSRQRIKPQRRATLFGTVICCTESERQASTGYWPVRRTRCIGDRKDDGTPKIPPEWTNMRPKRQMETTHRAVMEERWLKEMIIERKLKALCRRSGNRIDLVFAHYDEDRSGELDIDEFQTMLASIGDDLNKQELTWLVRELSRGLKKIGLEDFKRFVMRSNRVGVSCTAEWSKVFPNDFYTTLRKLYDPKQRAPKYHPLYTLPALARRDALKFDPSVRRSLNLLWKMIDLDKSGRIEQNEYVLMHEQVCRVMARLGKLSPKVAPGGKLDVSEQRKLALEDWEIDHQGFGFVDYSRFVSCWFQIADQFTDSITAKEYNSFLSRIVGNLFPEELCDNEAAISPRPLLPPELPCVEDASKDPAFHADFAMAAEKAAEAAARAATSASKVLSTFVGPDSVLARHIDMFNEWQKNERNSKLQKRLTAIVEGQRQRETQAAEAEASALLRVSIPPSVSTLAVAAASETAAVMARCCKEQEMTLGDAEERKQTEEAVRLKRSRAEAEVRHASVMAIQRIWRAATAGAEANRRRSESAAAGAAHQHIEDNVHLTRVEKDESLDIEVAEVLEVSRKVVLLEACPPRSPYDRGSTITSASADFLDSSEAARRAVIETAARRRIGRFIFACLVVPMRQRFAEAPLSCGQKKWMGRASKFYGGAWSDDDDKPDGTSPLTKCCVELAPCDAEFTNPTEDSEPALRVPCIFCKARAICVCGIKRRRKISRRRIRTVNQTAIKRGDHGLREKPAHPALLLPTEEAEPTFVRREHSLSLAVSRSSPLGMSISLPSLQGL